MHAELFLRYLLEFMYLIPACTLGYLSMGGNLRRSTRRTFCAMALLVLCAMVGGAALCTWLQAPGNALLLPFTVLCLLMRRHTTALPWDKTLFIMSFVGAVAASVTWGCVICCAPFEAANPYPHVRAVSTSLVTLGVMSAVTALLAPLMIHRIRWLMNAFDESRIWRTAWLFPACLTVLLVICMPVDYASLMTNRYCPIGVGLAAVLLLMVVGFLLFLYMMARVLTDRAALEQENQLLLIQRDRYEQLHATLNETRALRHDFRQHLRVIVGLAEKEQYQELRQYLKEYESEITDQRITLCRNPALDAIALYYDDQARREKIRISWRMDLPECLPLPEADLCMVAGNLLENAIHAASALPEQQRRIDVVCRMLGEGMIGLSIENTWDSTGAAPRKHPRGEGLGMKSVSAAVRKYGGTLDIQPGQELYSVRILMNVPISAALRGAALQSEAYQGT